MIETRYACGTATATVWLRLRLRYGHGTGTDTHTLGAVARHGTVRSQGQYFYCITVCIFYCSNESSVAEEELTLDCLCYWLTWE